MNHKKTILVLSVFVFAYFSNLVFATQATPIEKIRTPILFEKNIGQEDPAVKYFARGLSYNTLLAEQNARFRFRDHEFTIALEGSNSNSILKHVGSAASRIHYYAGNKESDWKTGIPAFHTAIYKEAYRGIDWKFYEAEGLVEFDFVVAPGADPSQVRMVVKDADTTSIDLNGDLIVTVDSHEFRILAPIVYQCVSNECDSKTTVKAEYILGADHRISFKVGSYDPNKTLVIDPKIAFGTMLGGNTFDNATNVAVDGKGNFYVVGYTEANTRIPGNGDAFVNKFSPTGALIWSTFLAGSSGEDARSIAVNPSGICFVGGSTSSRDFPIVGPFQQNFGGSLDGFIVKFAANGTIMRSSFIGGSGRDAVNGVELGTGPKLGNGVYLFGTTDSRNFPKKNATQQQFGGGRQDGFLTIVHALQFQQLLSTYVGLNGADVITSLALNKSRGDLYAAVLDEGGTERHFIGQFKPTNASVHNGAAK